MRIFAYIDGLTIPKNDDKIYQIVERKLFKMLDRNNPQPLYVQVHNILVGRLDSGIYKPHDRIPSENLLRQEFGVSRETLRSVLTELVRDGRLYRVQGKGTYVSEPKITAKDFTYVGIRRQLEELGYNVTTILLGVEKQPCPLSIAAHLQIPEGEEVYYIQRLRKVKEESLSIHNTYVPAALCPDFARNDFCNKQMCELLSEQYGLVRGRVRETLESVLAREDETELLGIKKGQPLLKLSDEIATADGQLFEYSTVVFRGDKLKIQLNYGF